MAKGLNWGRCSTVPPLLTLVRLLIEFIIHFSVLEESIIYIIAVSKILNHQIVIHAMRWSPIESRTLFAMLECST